MKIKYTILFLFLIPFVINAEEVDVTEEESHHEHHRNEIGIFPRWPCFRICSEQGGPSYKFGFTFWDWILSK